MKFIALTPDIEEIAKRIIWFEPPANAIRDPVRFLAYAFRYASHEDMQHLRQHVCEDDLREALHCAPPGIIDPRSWSYWHAILGQFPPPPMPVRRFE